MPAGFGQFGESIDFESGSTSFRKTVVELPGNNALRVAADFEYSPTDRLESQPQYEWRRSRPYIQGIHDAFYGWVVGIPGNYSGQRCSHSARTGVASALRSSKPPMDNFLPEDFWDGNTLGGVEGGGLIRPLVAGEPTLSGATALWATNTGWRFTCYLLPDGTEGYVGHRPNGDKYYFGIPVQGDEISWIKSNFHYDAESYLEVSLFKMFVTRIEDKFGNWVNYSDYQIASSDGRLITFENIPAGIRVTANGRQWTVGQGAGPGITVTNPDNSTWSINSTSHATNSFISLSDTCVPQQNIPSAYGGQAVIEVVTESGLKGTFVLQPRRHGYSYVSFSCDAITLSGPFFPSMPYFVDEISLVSRSVQGPGVTPYQHTISYGSVNACYVGGTNNPDPCTSGSPTTRTVTVSGPSGVDQYVFGNRVFVDAGLLLSKNTGGLQVQTNQYANVFSNYQGWGKRKMYGIESYTVQATKKSTTVLNGRNFSWEIPSDCGPSSNQLCIDSFFRPTKLIKSSAP